jgi:hypothetical protein
MQGIGLCFHDFDLGDLLETTRTNNQGEDFLDKIFISYTLFSVVCVYVNRKKEY